MPQNWTKWTKSDSVGSRNTDENFHELLEESLEDYKGNAYHTGSRRNTDCNSVSSRNSIGSLGSSTFGSLDSSTGNGLSAWYDNLKNDPAILYSATSSSRSSMSISSAPRTVSESETDSPAGGVQWHAEDLNEEGDDIWIEKDIPEYIKSWFAKLCIVNGNPFYGLQGVEYSPINSRKAVRSDPYHGVSWDTRSSFQYDWDGDVDKDGRFDGTGSLKFGDGGEVFGRWRNGVRVGRHTTSCPAQNIRQLSGEYKAGRLLGVGTVVLDNGESVEGHFRDGCLHGLARRLGVRGDLLWVGRYLHGVPDGTCWEFLPGGGCITGQADRNGKISGTLVTYIYPDWRTCLVGTFTDSILVSAQAARVESACLVKGILELQTSSPEGPNLTYELSTREKICSKMLHRDLYEQQMVEVKKSEADDAGEGVFACKDIPENTVVAFYNGIRIPADEADTDDSWEDCSYRIFVAIDDGTDIDNDDTERMDMPAMFRSTESYCATVAHKINHSFNPNCNFSKYIHPMFGPIPCVITSKNVTAGEELFTYYKYLLSDCPEWYSSLWEQQ